MATTDSFYQHQPRPDYSIVRWYALTHLDLDTLKQHIDKINEANEQSGTGPIYNYFIPYSFIKKRQKSDETSDHFDGSFSEQDIKENNRMRNTLRRFVFIKATGDEIKQLLRESWNRDSAIRLQPYAATVDNMKYVPDQRMDAFMSACYDLREKFELTPFIEDAGVGAEVVICEGKFKSAKARVKEIQHKADGIRLTLSVEFFARELDITLYDYTPDKVAMGDDASNFISATYTDYVQRLLLDILSRRVNHKETDQSHSDDLRTLSQIWRYQPTEVADHYQQAQVCALLLICARLRFDKAAQQRLIQKATALLNQFEARSESKRNGLSKAILHIALFLATGHPSHRMSAKALVFQHTIEPHPLRRFISLIRR